MRIRLVLLTLIAVALAACASDEATPPDELVETPACDIDEPPASGALLAADEDDPFFPLQVGNQWTYARRLELTIQIDGEPPEPPEVADLTIVRELTGVEVVGGVTYIIEEERTTKEDVPETGYKWWRFRQDDMGLYRAVIASDTPPAQSLAGQLQNVPDFVKRAALEQERRLSGAGEAPEEFWRLMYPLEVGSSWQSRPNVVATPFGEVRLDLPVGTVDAWRIDYETFFTASQDSLASWYGRCGLLKTYTLSIVYAMDPLTQKTATITRYESTVLTDIKLADDSQ